MSNGQTTHDREWDAQGVTLGDDPKAALKLPEGLLMLEGLPVTFHGATGYPVIQSKVLDAARHILDNRTPEQADKVFHNQAEVMAFASQQFGWHTGRDMRFVSTANFMNLPKQDDATKAAKAEEIDVIIEVLNSGLLTTREGAKKLFPDMDVDKAFDEHEQRIAEAKEQQQRQMDDIMAKIRQEKAEKGEQPAAEPAAQASDKERWADKVTSSRRSGANPCLGM